MKKSLILLEMGGVLGFSANIKSEGSELGMYKGLECNKDLEGWQFYFRPKYLKFLKDHMLNPLSPYEFGVWTSLSKEKARVQTEGYFGKLMHKLLFVKCSTHDTYRPAYKNIDEITRIYPEYNEFNTAFISCYPNLDLNFTRNDLLLPIFCPKISIDIEHDPHMSYLTLYLKMLEFTKTKVGNDIRDRLTYYPLKALKQKLSKATRSDQYGMEYLQDMYSNEKTY
jgi:hypothetical protein